MDFSRLAISFIRCQKGKINRDIADILGASPATVKKQLEHVYAKLGVETRTAAAGMAVNRIRQLHPQFEC